MRNDIQMYILFLFGLAFYCSIVDLQYCVSFRGTPQQFIYIYNIYIILVEEMGNVAYTNSDTFSCGLEK